MTTTNSLTTPSAPRAAWSAFSRPRRTGASRPTRARPWPGRTSTAIRRPPPPPPGEEGQGDAAAQRRAEAARSSSCRRPSRRPAPAGRPRGGWRPSVAMPRSRRATPRSFSASRAARPRKSPLSHRTTQLQPGLQRRDPGAELVAVQGRPGLQPQRVAGPQPGRRDPGGHHGIPAGPRADASRHGDLHAVLAGVAAVPATTHGTSPQRQRRQRRKRGTASVRQGTPTASSERADGPRIGQDGPRPGHVSVVVDPSAERTRAACSTLGMTSKRVLVDPPHDDVVEDRGAVGVEQMVYWAPPWRRSAAGRWSRALQPLQGIGAGHL